MLLQVRQPELEPEPLVDDDTVPKEPAASVADPVVPSETPSEPARDESVTEVEPAAELEPVRQSDGGESQPGEPGREPTHHHHHHPHKVFTCGHVTCGHVTCGHVTCGHVTDARGDRPVVYLCVHM